MTYTSVHLTSEDGTPVFRLSEEQTSSVSGITYRVLKIDMKSGDLTVFLTTQQVMALANAIMTGLAQKAWIAGEAA